MRIELGNMDDYATCKAIADAFSESTPTKEVFEELVHNSQIYVVRNKEKILGFISYKLLWNESIFLQFLRIDETEHRKGIASKLIEKVEEVSRERGAYEVFSTALETNTPSIKLHEKLGYKKAGYIDFDSGRELVFLKEL